ncbi:hypothetical protein S245_017072 [Arachis hypogaea]
MVSKGANTMDVGKAVLDQTEHRTRLDAGTWGTIGVGLVEGDFGFEFSAIEVKVDTAESMLMFIYLIALPLCYVD